MGSKLVMGAGKERDSNIPLKFVDTLDTKKHIVLFYEDPDYARKIEFQFIKNGLEKGEHCIYATEEDPGLIMLKMLNYGISIKGYFQKGFLHVYQIRDGLDSLVEHIKSAKENLKRILADSRPPVRLVSRIVADVSSLSGMTAEMKLEREFHNAFDDFGGSVICPYDITKIEASRSWIPYLLENHHAIIYAPKSRQGGVFFLR